MSRPRLRVSASLLTFLTVEPLGELVNGMAGTAWPLVRGDFPPSSPTWSSPPAGCLRTPGIGAGSV